MSVTLYNAQGQPQDFEPGDVADALKSGKYGAPAGQQFQVQDESGAVRSVGVHEVLGHLDKGGMLLSPEEAVQAQEQEQYGGLAGRAAAVVGGAIDTATFGLGNAALPDTAKDYLRHAEAANHGSKLIGQGLGLVGPLAAEVATGGAATPALAGEVGAEGLGGLARGAASAVAAPMRAVGVVGDVGGALTETALRSLVGKEATSAFGKLAEKGLIATGRGAAEGGLIGMAQTAGDELLEEHPDLTAEKLMHGGLMGAVLGGVGGGVLGVGGEMASRLRGSSSSLLDRTAEEQATRSLFATSDKRGMRSILRLASDEEGAALGENGVNVIGRFARDKGIVDAFDTVDSMLPKAQQVRQEAGSRVGTALDEADFRQIAGPSVKDINEQIEKTIDRLSSAKTLNSGVISKLQGLQDDILTKAGISMENVSERAMELQSEGVRPAMAQFRALTEAREKATLSFRDAQELRRDIDQHIDFETDVTKRVSPAGKALKAVRGAMEDEIERKLEAGDSLLSKSYLEAKEDFAKAKVVENVLTRSQATRASNRFFSPTDYGVGGAVAAGLMGGGAGPLGALAGIGSSVAHHLVREHGNSTAAVVLDKLASTTALAKLSGQSDRVLKRIAAGAISGAETYEHEHRIAIPKGYAAQRDMVLRAASDPSTESRIAASVAPITTNHPAIATAYAAKSAAALKYLDSQLPKEERPNPNSLTPHLDNPEVPAAARDAYMRKVAAVYDPMGAIAKIQTGTITKDERDAIEATHPELYAQTCQVLKGELAAAKKPIPYSVETSVRMFLKLPQTSPALAEMLKPEEMPRGPMPGPNAKGSRGGAPRRTVKSANLAKDFQLP